MKLFIMPVQDGCLLACGDERPEGQMAFVKDFDRTQIMGADNVINLPTLDLLHNVAAELMATICAAFSSQAETNRRMVEGN